MKAEQEVKNLSWVEHTKRADADSKDLNHVTNPLCDKSTVQSTIN